jgi:hydrogenase nickel incorporation protein HypA/HybF
LRSKPRATRAPRVAAVDVVIGDLSSIVDDSVQFYFDLLSRDTAAAGARLRLRRVPGRRSARRAAPPMASPPPLDPVCAGCGSLA